MKAIFIGYGIVLALSAAMLVITLMKARAESGIASVYVDKRTAAGIRFDPRAMACAHRTLPLGTRVVVHHGSRSAVLVVNDRGPYVRRRIVDLTPAAARALRVDGLGFVRLEVLR